MTHIYVQDMSFRIRLVINFFLQKVQVVSIEENSQLWLFKQCRRLKFHNQERLYLRDKAQAIF